MATFLTHFKAVPGEWPEQREAVLAVWESILGDSGALLEGKSSVKFSGWISDTEGYAIVESATKAEVIRLCSHFWPHFSNEIFELVPTQDAGPAILAGLNAGWDRKGL